MVLYGGNSKTNRIVNTSSSNINKQINSNKIPINKMTMLDRLQSKSPSIQNKNNHQSFLNIPSAHAVEVPADYLPGDPNRENIYEMSLASREANSGLQGLGLQGAPASITGLDNIDSGPTYAGDIEKLAAVETSPEYEKEVAQKTQSAYNDWYNNYSDKMNFNQYKKKFDIKSGSQQVPLNNNFSIGSNFGSASADIEIPNQYTTKQEELLAKFDVTKQPTKQEEILANFGVTDYVFNDTQKHVDEILGQSNPNKPIIDKQTTKFGTSTDDVFPVESKVIKYREDSDVSPQHMVDTWMNIQKNTDLPDAIRFGGTHNYTMDVDNNFINPFTGEQRGSGWNPDTGKYNKTSGDKVKTYGVGSEGKHGEQPVTYIHGFSGDYFSKSGGATIGEEGIFKSGTDMWISGNEPSGSDRFDNQTKADLRASSHASKKYNNIVSQWQAKHLKNVNNKNPEKQITAMTNFVNKKIEQIKSWDIKPDEKTYYINDLIERKNNMLAVIGPDPLSRVRVGQEKWFDGYSEPAKYGLSGGSIGTKKQNGVLTWKDLPQFKGF